MKAVLQAALILVLAIILGLGTNLLRSERLPLVADRFGERPVLAKEGEGVLISVDEAMKLYESGKALFVDARDRASFLKGHIQGAVNVPWQNGDEAMDRLLEIFPGPETIIVTYCDGEGCTLSTLLARRLLDMGLPHVRVLPNGWTTWKGRGLPVSQGEGA